MVENKITKILSKKKFYNVLLGNPNLSLTL